MPKLSSRLQVPGLGFLAGAVALVSCAPASQAQRQADASVERGRRLVGQFACGSCHQIPGVLGADGTVGPPLRGLARRSAIAGLLDNTPENLTSFIRLPQSVVKGGVMPDMGLTEAEAADAAAYLLSRS